jgi:hypothetical protein
VRGGHAEDEGRLELIDLGAVYVKTAKGQNEIATRAFRLPARERSLLVMVDGKTTGRDLIARTAQLGDSAAFFTRLVEEGFVEAATAVAVSAPAAPSRPPAAAKVAPPAQAPSAGVPLPREVVQLASRKLADLLGPSGDVFAARLEACRGRDDFIKQLEKCREVIAGVAGKQAADKFWEELSARLA